MANEARSYFPSEVPEQPKNLDCASHKNDKPTEATKPALKEISPEAFRALLRFSEKDERPQVAIWPLLYSYKSNITRTTCHQLFNAIVATLKEEHVSSIEFHVQGDKAPKDSPAGRSCHPDVIAFDRSQLAVDRATGSRTRSTINQSISLVSTESEYRDWTRLEAIGVFESMGKEKEKDLIQVLKCIARHLLSRPDRVVVLSFYIRHTGFYLILTGASGACRTTKLSWTNSNHIELLCDFIYRILKPSANMIDPTITRNHDCDFDIKLNESHYSGCRLKWLGSAIGRRTTIFLTQVPTVPIIKEQYLLEPLDEVGIINEIHENGPIPGVVQVHDHQELREGDLAVVCSIDIEEKRHKVRLSLKESGIPFMDIQTPYEVLVATYDLLETTRCIYTNRGILHRDISKGNVLYRSEVPRVEREGTVSLASDVASSTEEAGSLREKPNKLVFCSIQHLLDEKHPRKTTPVLLIDFDHAIQVAQAEPFTSVGTPIFQARAAAATTPVDPGTGVLLGGMPDLSEAARPRYMKVLSDRVKRFPSRPTLDIILRTTQEAADREWFHQLRHDAESVFWLLLWWVIHVRPDNDKSPTHIPEDLWKTLTQPTKSQYDSRTGLLTTMQTQRGWLDPAYMALEELVRKMAAHIQGDLHWVTDKHPEEMKDPEYVHEAFQRLIFNFLVENQSESFMAQENHSKNREVGSSVHSVFSDGYFPSSRSTATQLHRL
ncbi:hypothetical protein M408DRAFT_28288 [Serendipita vermifera MAFF 305830]|uniref:Fungal-type protein kinase domain-containing protein n=1 Tax=Serendipita vermifera MAFF 305830 TaxID=933852 RepID=A0A0C2X061_SERVB|nr:hypothetical protein M408DRAFT_28288 [Serendipita vermifera MAFF 305830]